MEDSAKVVNGFPSETIYVKTSVIGGWQDPK